MVYISANLLAANIIASMIIVVLCLCCLALSLIACYVDKRIQRGKASSSNRKATTPSSIATIPSETPNGPPVLAKKTNFFIEMFQF